MTKSRFICLDWMNPNFDVDNCKHDSLKKSISIILRSIIVDVKYWGIVYFPNRVVSLENCYWLWCILLLVWKNTRVAYVIVLIWEQEINEHNYRFLNIHEWNMFRNCRKPLITKCYYYRISIGCVFVRSKNGILEYSKNPFMRFPYRFNSMIWDRYTYIAIIILTISAVVFLYAIRRYSITHKCSKRLFIQYNNMKYRILMVFVSACRVSWRIMKIGII